MLEETIDPRPPLRSFAERLAALSGSRCGERAQLDWLRHWNDREDPWTNLRTLEHWLHLARD
ncbi:MAG TPA: hypothetical protein VLM41_09125 [Steroidobacteraceae bacterium]|nr:hypothetical protein [Steroidobacteraceae bacterium]